jgi:adenosylhomocysteine nucleosidase
MPVSAVTGLAAEAAIARRRGLAAIATVGDAARIADAVEMLVARGADAVVSFGIAGALSPGLVPGDLLLPHVVCDEAGAAFPVDAAWRAKIAARLHALGIAPVDGDLLGAAEIAAGPAAKTMLRLRTGAVAVDLESHLVAAAARRHGVRYLAFRSVADPAHFSLPPAAAVGLDATGRIALGPVLRSLLREPAQLPAVLRLAAHTRRALAVLSRAAAVLD